ncbi:MAG: HAMP domain-containing sensor histidine kinase [Bacteroidales bacterium]|jgi:two-component system phosphate regulon sensor histidine kinase PhoR|nr:HAMP domain-containing sensor histidine kinase [Bacteroidales bacterium]
MRKGIKNRIRGVFPIIVLLIGLISLCLIVIGIKPIALFYSLTILSLLILFYLIIQNKKEIRAIENFIGSLTHELKTPLSTISLIIENLRQRRDKENENEYRIIEEENKRSREIIERILYASRFKNYSIIREEFNINDLITDICNRIMSSFNAIDIILRLDNGNSIIFADRLHITNVINTLIDNSIKYNDNSPKIEIETRRMKNYLEIGIRDNGIGIPKKERDKVFRKYYRAKNTKDRKGFGIGLSYVREVVLAHNGRVIIDKEIEIGTRIIILLPIYE